MKTPTIHTRREFLANCGAVSIGMAIPQFLTHTAAAVGGQAGWEPGSGAALPGFKDDHVLVVIQLSGGNDGLNTLVPHTDDAYFRARPRLALRAKDCIRLTDDLSLNRNLSGLRELYDEGNVAIVEGVGYPNPDRSHFRSMEIWHAASDSDQILADGWVGRYFDNHCQGRPVPTAGVSIGEDQVPQAFEGTKGMGVAFSNPDQFGYIGGKMGDDTQSFRALNRPDASSRNKSLDFVRHVTANAMVSADKIHQVARKTRNTIPYPGGPVARHLSIVARMIGGGLGARIYYVSLGGFDTHTNQRGQQDRLLRLYSQGVSAFMKDLKSMGAGRQVTIMTFSEFGRRVGENANQGTDHGTAAPMFVIGEQVKGGLKGERPSLTDLDEGDLQFTTDFRSVYASVLNQWFSVDPATVFGREFPTLDLIQA